MSENFQRAIRDLDTRDPRAFQDARHAILDEIRVHQEVSPQAIVNRINEVENQPGHGHQDVRLVNRNGYLDIVPANYGNQGEYRPRPPYEGGYPQPGYPQQGYPQEGYQRQGIDPGSLIIGGAIGAGIGALLHNRHER